MNTLKQTIELIKKDENVCNLVIEVLEYHTKGEKHPDHLTQVEAELLFKGYEKKDKEILLKLLKNENY